MDQATREQLLAVVEASPAAVAIHDKTAWMSIFAEYHIVEDPVGSTPHLGGVYDGKSGKRGNEALSRFFDTFIAPNQIKFAVNHDYVCGNHVVRDLTIHITMSDKVVVQTPMHLLYELENVAGAWKIKRLAAHWELVPMLIQLAKKGLDCLPIMGSLSVRMMKYQGLSGILGFSKAAISIGSAGKEKVNQFVNAFNNRQLADLMNVMDNDNRIIHWPFGDLPVSPSELFDNVNGKLIISDKQIAAGNVVSVSATWELEGEQKSTVMLVEFNRKTGKISAIRCYN